jgi:hypothetical protein
MEEETSTGDKQSSKIQNGKTQDQAIFSQRLELRRYGNIIRFFSIS